MSKKTKPLNGVWVLTNEYNDYDQHGEYFQAVFSEEPTLETLAEYFNEKAENKPYLPDAMAAVVFLEKLRKGGGRNGTEDCWWNLEFVEFSS